MRRPVGSAATFAIVVVVVATTAAVITYDLPAQPLVWCIGDDDADNGDVYSPWLCVQMSCNDN